MAKGIGIHIGLNEVNPTHYGGWSGPLTACEADAEDMASLCAKFKTTLLLTKKATRSAVLKAISSAAASLVSGDSLVLSYSGHGGQLPDLNNDENDGIDETWCLYDGELVDDELYQLWAKFKAGVKIAVFSDSCHSGSVTKMAFFHGETAAGPAETSRIKFRNMPHDVEQKTYRKNKAFYDQILRATPKKKKAAKVAASVLLISGCQDNQLSADGSFNGLFTGKMLTVWNNGAFTGGYKKLHSSILKVMPPNQTPNFYRVGATNAKFEAQRPFTA